MTFIMCSRQLIALRIFGGSGWCEIKGVFGRATPALNVRQPQNNSRSIAQHLNVIYCCARLG
jgi:hypothetical protein